MGGPLQYARQMMGCLDETGNLEYGQVFVQYSKPENISSYLVEGEIVVAENPCLYPGDVRVLKDVDVEALHHMVDCVVFPKKKMDQEIVDHFTNFITKDNLGRKTNTEDIGAAMRSLRKETRSWFEREGGQYGENVRASTMYYVTYNEDYFISFSWCIYDRLVQIKMRDTDVSLAGG
ncbi:hypothetical protein RD792_008567 [Penstemon davidsonii]|uniref:RNA-dependent RNA polymerase n=1 Tax=Penstemon davidsonii TaxID=160366 RepID=A0ABR0DAG3_9LAMI|nr:hypothetical protein RD792_008567 [Penstemon davidsonii]